MIYHLRIRIHCYSYFHYRIGNNTAAAAGAGESTTNAATDTAKINVRWKCCFEHITFGHTNVDNVVMSSTVDLSVAEPPV